MNHERRTLLAPPSNDLGAHMAHAYRSPNFSLILSSIDSAPFAIIDEGERTVLTRIVVNAERVLGSCSGPGDYATASSLLAIVADRVEQDANTHIIAGNEIKAGIVREIADLIVRLAERLTPRRAA
jgi:hypothetical protein